MFCGVPVEAVVSSPDARSIYEVPIILEKQGIADYIIKRMNLTPYTTKRNMKDWEEFLKRVTEPKDEVTIALVGKYTKLADSYLSHIEAFTHAGAEADTKVHIKMIDSDDILKNGADKMLGDVDGVLVPGGFGVRGVEGMIEATRYARENKIPFLGVCLGFQIATIGIARHVLGLKDANSTEFDENTKNPVIFMMGEQTTVEDKGATMRLGAQDVDVREGSVAYGLYDATKISERHRHRYEVNPSFPASHESCQFVPCSGVCASRRQGGNPLVATLLRAFHPGVSPLPKPYP